MEFQIVIILVSVLFSAFFSGMEIAFVSANKLQIEIEKKKEGAIASILEKLTRKSSKFITTMLVGNNIALVIYSFFMGEFIISFSVFSEFNPFSVLLIQTLISTLVILITAEFLPKAIFRIYANETLRIFAVPAYFFYLLFFYISDFITLISDFVLKMFFKTNPENDTKEFSKAELGNYINEQLENTSERSQVDSEIQIFQNALEFHNVKAREIMIPRTEIIAVESTDTLEFLKQQFIDTGYSKILVYKSSLDDIIGYVHAFELFKNPKNMRSILLPVEFIPESMFISDVINLLTKRKKSMAVVLDEYGGTSGIVTVEDIVEELFGEIVDEHDTITLREEVLSTTEYNFSARLEIDYLNDAYGLKLPENDAYETLGGLIVYHNEAIPSIGDKVITEGFYFEMLQVDSSKILEVYLRVLEKKE
ncbi:MAG: HlyC/CorC family transporter [Flavobacteriaceae bacterium]|nr:HlyC/CorC family transporter [Flavobacteriaceae bacterium]